MNLSIEKAQLTSSLQGPAYYWFFVKCMAVTAVLFVFATFLYRGKSYMQEEQA